MSDEGGLWPVIIGLLIAVVILVLGILLYNHLFHAGQGLPNEERCRASIIANGKIVHGSAGTLNSKIQCEAKDVTIATRDQQAARHQLAESLRSCWDRWQHGSLELFKGEGTFCNPCAFVTLQHDLTDFNRFLFLTPVEKGGPTYTQYLTSTSTEYAAGNVPELPKDTPRELLPAGQYAILFVDAKGQAAVGKLRENIDKNPAYAHKKIIQYAGTAAVVGGVAGGVGGGVVGYLLSAAAISAVVPGPGWVVAGITAVGAGAVAAVGAIIGATAGAAGGTALAGQTQLELPAWTAQVVLLPNRAEEIARWGCTKTTQQLTAPPGPEDV